MSLALGHLRSGPGIPASGVAQRRRLVKPAPGVRLEALPASRLVGFPRAHHYPLVALDQPLGLVGGAPQTMHTAMVLVMLSASASSCGIGSKGWPR